MPDSSYALTAAITEMVLQSYDRIIRVVPAIPSEWSAGFRGFLAAGSFEVDADVEAGEVTYLSVRSLGGSRCRVYNPWPDADVCVTEKGKRIAHRMLAGVVEFDTVPGESYSLSRVGQASGPVAAAPLDAPTGPSAYVGPAYLGEIPEQERVPIWLGLPEAAPARG
jgi:hypothetical protein